MGAVRAVCGPTHVGCLFQVVPLLIGFVNQASTPADVQLADHVWKARKVAETMVRPETLRAVVSKAKNSRLTWVPSSGVLT